MAGVSASADARLAPDGSSDLRAELDWLGGRRVDWRQSRAYGRRRSRRLYGPIVLDAAALPGRSSEVGNVELSVIRKRLQSHRGMDLGSSTDQRAAVALVLQPGLQGSEILAIRRTERPGDPWSGHMALPGGRMDPSDSDLAFTAARETHEEVGIDLARRGRAIGKLDDLRAMSRGKAVDLIISPYVYSLDEPHPAVPNPREVKEAFWIPLRHLVDQHPSLGTNATPRYTEDGYPAFYIDDNAIWGLTYRIVGTLLEIVHGG